MLSLADLCAEVSHPLRAVAALGLGQHPGVRGLLGEGPLGSSGAHGSAVKKISYRCDLVSQNIDLQSSLPPRRMLGKCGERWVPPPVRGLKA